MNNDRRKAIGEIGQRLEVAREIIDSCRDELEAIKDSEDEYRDSMPESLHAGDRYAASEAASEALENALETLGDLSFDDLQSHLEKASA